jgi:hypothetical protein
MDKNWLKYLGLLGLLGLIGIFTSKPGLYGFFGFFGFFGFANIKSDERLIENINKAAKNAFVSSLLTLIFTIIIGSIITDFIVYFYGIMICFIQHILVFTLSFYYYDKGI